jgi:hypothetical protein
MADKADKPKKSKAKPKKDEKNVLGSLSATRTERIGTRRANAARSPATAKPASAAVKPASSAKTANLRSAAAKPAPSAKTGAAKPSTPRATATRRKAAAPRTFEPTEAAESAAGAADERAGPAVPLTETAREPRPRPVREGAPGIGTTDAREREQPSPESARPSGAELVTTAVKAAGELAQVGITIGGQLLKRAVDRLPRP